MVTSPLRRLQGITYWVIEDPEEIYDFINTNVRKEWEGDIEFTGGNPREDPWLQTLSYRVWRLEILKTSLVKLDPRIMNYRNPKKGYSFAESLAIRVKELRRTIETYGSVIWPIVLDGEEMRLVDGYCRFTALTEMGVSQIYAYTGKVRP
jgi:hypothetical protein